jgi:hypothetical protein
MIHAVLVANYREQGFFYFSGKQISQQIETTQRMKTVFYQLGCFYPLGKIFAFFQRINFKGIMSNPRKG